MDSYVTEEQQVEAIKKWWKESGNSVITGAILGLALVFGWRAWNDWRYGKAEAASELFQRIEIGLRANNAGIIQQFGKRLMDEYPDSIYAIFGALAQAAFFVNNGDLASARGNLEWVITQANDPNIKALAQVRLAQIFFDQGDYEKSLSLCDAAASSGLTAEADELRGDILVAKGNQAAARNAYKQALAKLTNNPNVAANINLKLDDLGENP